MYRQKKGGGSAQFQHSASCASKWRRPGWSRFCDHAPDGSAASQNLYFSNVAPKILENAENAQKKERPEVTWFTVTVRRATGRPDVGAGRIQAADRPKNFNRFESHFQHLSNEDESGRFKPDLQEFSRWPCWPCHVKGSPKRQRSLDLALPRHKKKWIKKGTEQNAFEPATTRSKSQRSTTSAILESMNACEKNSIESCRRPPRSARFSVRKRCVVCFWLKMNKSKFSLFRLPNNLCCHWCWSLCSRSYPNPSKKHKKRPQVAHPHSIAKGFLWFGLPHADSAVAILRHTSHCGETARFLPPFFGGTQHPLI